MNKIKNRAMLWVCSCMVLISCVRNTSSHNESADVEHAGIRFEQGNWETIVKKASEQKQLIFADFYTQWCGPCYRMTEEVFPLFEVGALYNRHFVNVKIDAESEGGKNLAKKYEVKSYPTFLFIDPVTKEVVHRSGYRQSAEQFIYTGQSAIDSQRRSVYLNEEYKKGNREKNFLINYIHYHHSMFDLTAVNKAFKELMKEKAGLKDKQIWTAFVENVNYSSPYLKEVSDHYETYCSLYGKNVVDEKLAKETRFADLAFVDSLCDFEGKRLNCELIRINQALYRRHDYDEAIERIDALIANPKIDQQKVIKELKFFARIRGDEDHLPDKWFNKCVEYLRYVAYNTADRKDYEAYFSYIEILEKVIGRTTTKKTIPAVLLQEPAHGKKELSMRPDALKKKPIRKAKR